MFFSTSCYFELCMISIGIIWTCIMMLLLAVKLGSAVRIYIIPHLFPSDLTTHGKWAVVTGGSSGIGKSFAHHLAKRGINVVIISNELGALQLTATEIESLHGVQCCYVHADFTEGTEVYEKVAEQLKGKDIGLLINGAGILGTLPCCFLEETEKNVLSMIDLHITAVVYMTLKVLPLMLAKNKGVIVNISSAASFRPLATWNVYSSCKAFSNIFSRGLLWEYKNYKTGFQSLTPFFVSTGMIENISGLPRLMGIIPSGETFVASAVNTIGIASNTTGYWGHELIGSAIKCVPDIIVNKYCMMKIMRRK